VLSDRSSGDDPGVVSAACSQEVRQLEGSQGRASPQRERHSELVLELARNNPGWGYTKIRDALRGLKVEIGRTTVANLFAETGIEPAPERRRQGTWKQFLGRHWETLYSCDFFAVETLGAFGTAA
jgi:putative transposase